MNILLVVKSKQNYFLCKINILKYTTKHLKKTISYLQYFTLVKYPILFKIYKIKFELLASLKL